MSGIRQAALVMLMLPILVCLLTLGEYLFAGNLPIDALLINERLAPPGNPAILVT